VDEDAGLASSGQRELVSRLVAIVESSDDAIIGKTLDGIITSWNPGAERMYGYTAQEMVGRSVATIFPPDRLGELAPILDQLRRGGGQSIISRPAASARTGRSLMCPFRSPRSGTRRGPWSERRRWPVT